MLENLEHVNWQDVHLWNGTATNTPVLIRQLASDNAEIRWQAYLQFYDDYFEQQSPHAAMDYPLPFLIELLENKAVQDKQNILGLLSGLAARGSNEELIAKWATHVSKEWIDQIRRQYNAVRQSINVYLALLDDSSPEVRIAASDILQFMTSDVSIVVPIMLSRIGIEEDVKVKGLLVTYIRPLLEKDTNSTLEITAKYLELCKSLLNPQESAFVRFTAAASLAILVETDSPSITDAVLFEALKNAALYESMLSESLVRIDALKGLVSSGLDRNISLLTYAIKYSLSESQAFHIGREVLDCVFDKHDPLQQISDIQHSVLTAIVDSENFWRESKMFHSLAKYGLPSSREQLRLVLTQK
ncbi:MAG: hypothetical protein ABI947_24985 [Chloroflexota bacterium]